MNNIVKNLSAIILISLILTGCKGTSSQRNQGSKDTGPEETVDEAVLENAKTVYDLASYMTLNEDLLLYSECKHDKDLHFYFDVLSFDEYLKVNYKGNDYALLYYDYSSYGSVVTDIKSVNKSYSAGSLDLEINVKTKEISHMGDFPDRTRCRLILKLDQNVSSINVMGRPFNEYSGGYVYICGKEGIVDKDLNFVLPPVYDGIYELYTFEESSCPMYYRVFKDRGNGVLDNNFNQVLSNSYGNIYYINENKFIVGTIQPDPALKEILIVDGNENVIIEPVYYNIYFLDGRYKVEDSDSNELYFDIDGNLI